MGNIRGSYIKDIAVDLVKKYPNEFSTDFEHNKQVVEKLTDLKYKDLRNRIAGYITRYRARYEA